MGKSEAVNNKNKIKFVDWKWWMRCDARTNRMFVNGIKIVRALCRNSMKKKQEKNKKKWESCVKDGTQAKSAKSNSFREFSFHFFCRRFQLILKYFSKTILPLILATWIATEQWQPDWMKVVKMNEYNDKQKKINQFSSYWKIQNNMKIWFAPTHSKQEIYLTYLSEFEVKNAAKTNVFTYHIGLQTVTGLEQFSFQ